MPRADSKQLLRMWVVSSPVLNGLIFKHLHLSWSPPFRVSERIMDTSKVMLIDEVCHCPRMPVSLWGLTLSDSMNLRDNQILAYLRHLDRHFVWPFPLVGQHIAFICLAADDLCHGTLRTRSCWSLSSCKMDPR